MSLSNAERIRLEALEENVRNIAQLVRGGGSKNQLNRLLVLAQEQSRKLTVRVAALETEMAIILTNVRRLQ